MLCKQRTPILRSIQESADVRLLLMHAAVTRTAAVKLDLILAGIQRLADVKLDLILSYQILAPGAVKLDLIHAGVGQPVTAVISLPLK